MSFPLSIKSRRRGMALFIVLAVLVLVAALVIGFFSSMSTEVKSSRSYASGVSSKQLADSAVQLVVAQIIDATKGKNASGSLAWASQPGMIRTYDQTGGPAKYYKLYSSGTMVQDGAGFSVAAEAAPADWSTKQGLFTDLNSPVSRDGKMIFPIIDGNFIKSLTQTESGQTVTAYLGYDANNDGKPDIEGFAVDASSVNYTPGQSLSPTNNPVAMPVKWLYVLQNGKLATPIASSGGTVSFDTATGANAPSAINPIVGRIAFWADDETCKVNINTASEGTFWDRPWANTVTEQKYSTAIPGQNEFQRYPGHPSKISLSTVFGSLLPSPNPAWFSGISSGQQNINEAQLKAYYDLAPRVSNIDANGSPAGTQGGNVDNVTIDANGTSGTPNFNPIKPDSDRLYASTDELLYSPILNGSTRAVNSGTINNEVLERTKFFITAHSRSPEINLFGKPRVTLWPLQAESSMRNAKDKLIAFCSEIGGRPYYFQRASVYTPPASAFSLGSPSSSSQSPTMDWTQVARNRDLYAYLDSLTSQNIPGFGGNFQAKYPSTRKQILTEMFDMIRSGVNSYSTALTPAYSYAPKLGDPGEGQIIPLQPGNGTQGFGRYATVTGAALVFFRGNPAFYSKTSSGAIVTSGTPAVVVTTPDPQIQAVLILNPFTPSPGLPTWSPNLRYVVSGLDKFKINGSSMGFSSPLANAVTSRVGFSGGGNATPFLGLRAAFRYADDVGLGTAGLDTTKTLGFTDPIKQYALWTGTSGVTISGTATTFDFTGTTITIQIYSASDGSTPIQTVNMDFPSAIGLSIPTIRPVAPGPATNTDYLYYTRFQEQHTNSFNSARDARYRFMQSYTVPTPAGNPAYVTYPSLGNDVNGNPVTYSVHDVVRGVEADPTGPAKGDLRFYAALNNVPSGYFKPSPRYGDSTILFTHGLRDEGILAGNGQFGYDDSQGGVEPHRAVFPDSGANVLGLTTIQPNSGFLVQQQYLGAYAGPSDRGTPGQKEYRAAASPAVPRGLSAALLNNNTAPGDWDNMTGLMEDGPFINKPDEGNSTTVSKMTSAYVNKSISGGYFSFGLDLFATGGDYKSEAGQTFSPNRQVSSAVMFGSLPTGIDATNASNAKPWQTLLFCANPPAGSAHPGFGAPGSSPPYSTPPDHLMLDLFTMPVVEPYAISEPFSTAGKINMNYQMVPFTGIVRDTGVRAVLKSTKLMAIPSAASTVTTVNSYKDGSAGYPYELRYDINPDEQDGTLAGLKQRFDASDIFRSPAEICGILLVPKKIPNRTYPPGVTEPTYSNTVDWWNNKGPNGTGFRLTGDNVREAPYGDIYARLTTKSNTYTVHYKVQTLKKVPSTSATQWVEGKDQVTGEIRGSSTVERYIDLNNPSLPDFATDLSASAEDYYKVHIIGSTTFAP